jgi:hypothetical protein
MTFRTTAESGFKTAQAREPDTGVIHILRQSKDFTWDGLVSREKIFEEIPIKTHGIGPHALRHTFATSFKPRGKSKSHSESYERQESCDNGSVSAFSKPRVGKDGERFEIVGRLECSVSDD